MMRKSKISSALQPWRFQYQAGLVVTLVTYFLLNLIFTLTAQDIFLLAIAIDLLLVVLTLIIYKNRMGRSLKQYKALVNCIENLPQIEKDPYWPKTLHSEFLRHSYIAQAQQQVNSLVRTYTLTDLSLEKVHFLQPILEKYGIEPTHVTVGLEID